MEITDRTIKKLRTKIGSSLTCTKKQTPSDCVWTVRLALSEELLKGEQPQDKSHWDSNCARFGLEPSDRLRTFVKRGRTFRVLTIAPRRPKYPVIALGNQGGRYKFKLSDIKALTATGDSNEVPAVSTEVEANLTDTSEDQDDL